MCILDLSFDSLSMGISGSEPWQINFSDYFSAIGNFQLKFNMDNSASDYFDNIAYILLHLQIFMLIN